MEAACDGDMLTYADVCLHMLARLARSQASGRGAVGSGEGVVRDLLQVPDVKPPRHKPLIDAILGKQVYLCVCRGRGGGWRRACLKGY